MARRLGPMLSPWSLERSARDLLVADRSLTGLYLDELNRQAGFPAVRVERPLSVKVRWRASRFSEDMLPGLVLVNAGTVGVPDRDGEGRYSAVWQMTVAAISQATDEDVGREVASDLCTAATLVLLQHWSKVDARVGFVRWIGAVTTDVDVDGDERSRCIFANGLQFGVADCLSDLAGLPADWDEPDPPIGQPPLDTGELGRVGSAAVVSAVPVDTPV